MGSIDPKIHDQTHLLQSADQLKLLDEIDKLRSQGIAHYVSLPQLVVCGDQSSGKSSVLEAISGISFPSKDNLCTTFATEVILRKASKESISIHIIPSKIRNAAEEARLKNFGVTLQNLDEFPALVDKAKAHMGISDTAGAFSNDVLRVEISGPDRPHLTIVDLPGLIHSENKMQSKSDVNMVWTMVREYMENKRTVILAVVSARNDYANQAVLKLAREIDAGGNRTLGIITKPDTLPVGSDSEASFISLSQNEDISFRLGWHVVRNRKYEERNDPSELRNATETAFFSQGVWRSLPPSMVGVASLRIRLSKVLLDQIKNELPALVDDIKGNLADCETKLAKLGSQRSTLHEQRLFLLHIGQTFQALARAAIDGVYDNSFFGDSHSDIGYSKRLRAVIQNLNLDFAATMRDRGQSRRIVEEDDEWTQDDLYTGECITRGGFEAEIHQLLRSSRGRELPGMFNPLIVGEIFHQQAKPWKPLASDHTQQVWEAVRAFIALALEDITDENTLDGLLREIIDPMMQQRLRSLNDKMREILLPHIEGHPITYNHYFTESIQSIRQQRLERDVQSRLSSLFGIKDQSGREDDRTLKGLGASHFKIHELVSALTSQREADMDKFACSEILLCMEAYYKVAMKVLVDNVAVQAIEACLLTQLPDILSPTSVMSMDDDTVTRIAAEPEENQAMREQLSRKLTVLKAGLDICNRYTRRQATPHIAVSKLPVENPWKREKGTMSPPPSDIDGVDSDSKHRFDSRSPLKDTENASLLSSPAPEVAKSDPPAPVAERWSEIEPLEPMATAPPQVEEVAPALDEEDPGFFGFKSRKIQSVKKGKKGKKASFYAEEEKPVEAKPDLVDDEWTFGGHHSARLF